MLYLKDIKEQERRNGDRLTFLQKKMKKLKRKNYQDNDFIKWLKQKYNDKDSGLFTFILPNIAEDLFVWRKYLGSYLLCKISEKEASAD